MKDFIFKIDHWFANLFHEFYLWGGDFATNFMKGISFLAEAGILFLLIGLGLALFKRTRKIGGAILCAVAIGFVLTNVILKNVIARPRPFESINGDFYKWWISTGAVSESGYSFPSGHTTATTAFAVAIFLTTNKKYSWPILTLPILMASSRIYLMVHYFSDCLGGLIVGAVSATLAYIIIKLIYKSNLKFFVWIKEFNIFKPKQKIKTKSPTHTEHTTENTSNDYVYITQVEENSSTTIQPTTSQADNEENSQSASKE